MGSTFSSHAEAPSSIDSLTDEEVYTLIRDRADDAAIRAPNETIDLIPNTVWRISQDAVAKVVLDSPTEVFMMSYVSSHTSIPIPKVRRVLSARASEPNPEADWIVMDYIPGNTLETEWPKMSLWRRLCAVWSIHRYIQELRRVPVPRDVPGPFDGSGRPYLCRGYYFTEDGSGPFHSYLDMAAWFDRRRFDVLAAIHSATGVIPHCPKFNSSYPLVLCHMDLHMRNIVVDANGKVWVIDWANAGAFPPWMEYAHMAVWADAAREEACPPKLWTFFMSFMTGNYGRYKTGYLDKLCWAWDRPSDDFFSLDYFSNLGLTLD